MFVYCLWSYNSSSVISIRMGPIVAVVWSKSIRCSSLRFFFFFVFFSIIIPNIISTAAEQQQLTNFMRRIHMFCFCVCLKIALFATYEVNVLWMIKGKGDDSKLLPSMNGNSTWYLMESMHIELNENHREINTCVRICACLFSYTLNFAFVIDFPNIWMISKHIQWNYREMIITFQLNRAHNFMFSLHISRSLRPAININGGSSKNARGIK